MLVSGCSWCQSTAAATLPGHLLEILAQPPCACLDTSLLHGKACNEICTCTTSVCSCSDAPLRPAPSRRPWTCHGASRRRPRCASAAMSLLSGAGTWAGAGVTPAVPTSLIIHTPLSHAFLQMHLAFTRQTTLACLAFSLAHTRRVPFPSPLTTIVSRRLPSCNTARARPAQHNPQNLRGCCVQPWRNGAKSFKFPCGHRTRQSTLQSTPEFSHESVCAPVMTSDGSGWPQGSSCSSGGHAGSSCLRSSICTHRTGTSAHCSRLRTVRRIPNLAHMQLRVGQGACFQAA